MRKLKYDHDPVVNAIYEEQITPEFVNNPLIEALPFPVELEQLIEEIRYMPYFTDEELNSSNIGVKLTALDKIKKFRLPLDMYPQIQYNLDSLLRWGYEKRNPCSKIETLRRLNIADLRNQNSISFGTKSHSEMMMITGDSGMGKSTAIDNALSFYPQVIIHSIYNEKPLTQTQIVWLKIDCPCEGSLSQLCQRFFHAIDSLLGTQHLEQSGLSTRNVDRMVCDMMSLADKYAIGVLIIDEIQNLLNSRSEQDEVVNFLTEISNTVAMPLILIGTANASKILSKFRVARRATSQADIYWDRMKIDGDDWKLLVKGHLFKLQISKDKILMTDEINQALFDCSQGITQVVVNLWRFTQKRSLLYSKKVDSKLIYKTAETDMPNVSRIVKAIRDCDLRALSQYEDLKTSLEMDEESYKKRVESRYAYKELYRQKMDQMDFTKIDYINNLEAEVMALGLCRNLNTNQVRKIVETVVNDNLETDYNIIRGIAIREAIEINDEKKPLPKTVKQKPKEEGLIEIHQNSEKSNAELLRDKGYIKEHDDLLNEGF